MHVSVSAPSALQDDLAPVFTGQVCDHLACLCKLDDRSLRDLQDDVLSVSTMLAFLSSVLPVSGGKLSVMAISHECVGVIVHLEDNVPASSAVASVRASVRDKLFPPETHMPVPALTGAYDNLCPVSKHNNLEI